MSTIGLINSESIRNYAETSVQTYYAIIEGDTHVGGLSRTKENAIENMQDHIEFLCCQSMYELAKHYKLQLEGEHPFDHKTQMVYCDKIINHFEKLKSNAGVINP